jgi:hypothetical protein
LTYSQASIAGLAGDEIVPDVPTVVGSVNAFSISPTLPAGLSLDVSTGIISGTPNGAAPQATYEVTARNAGGSATANLTITVAAVPNVLVELGHASPIQTIRTELGRVLSADQSGHWVLWDYASAKILANGDGSPNPIYGPSAQSLTIQQIDMAGPTFVVALPGGLELRATSDGHLISAVPYPAINQLPTGTTPVPWWQLSSDGSYIEIGSQKGLAIYSTSGQLSISKPGDYSAGKAFSAPGNILVALGPAGPNVIESISVADGSSTLSPQFSGQFHSWFLDGSRFLTTLSTDVWVYSSAAVQQAIVSLPTVSNLTGQGNWIWTFQTGYPESPLSIYAIGSDTPAFTYDAGIDDQPVASGNTIGVLSYGPGQITAIDLSGTTPTATNYSTPICYLKTYAFLSNSQWVAGNTHGALVDGASLLATPRYFGHGEAWGFAGSPTRAAVSTAIGEILLFDPSSFELEGQIGFSGGTLAMSADGSVLGAEGNGNDAQYSPDRTLNFYSLPSGDIVSSFPYIFAEGQPYPLYFSLAASGTTIAQNIWVPQSYSGSRTTTGTVTGITGTPTILTVILTGPDSMNPLQLSPDGTLVAVNIENDEPITNIYQNTILIAAVPGLGVGWIDNNRLLVDEYIAGNPQPSGLQLQYSGAAIYSSTGTLITSLPTLPAMASMQPVTSDSIYDQYSNKIYSLTTGQPTWTGTYPTQLPDGGLGTVAGQYILYQAGHRIIEERP